MTCSKCAIHSGDFVSESDYLKFSKKLSNGVMSGDLTKIGQAQSSEPFLKFRYACTCCGAHWTLSVPDQAFRGEWKEITCK